MLHVGFDYWHLDDLEVREEMVRLWKAERDDLSTNWSRDQCYGKQLSDAGWLAFPKSMVAALAERDDAWLMQEMSPAEFWMPKSPRRTKTGVIMVNYNKADALERLCFGEFNIAYIHGLATVLIARGDTECLVYRANPAYDPRGECSAWEGQTFPLADVLAGHRARYHPPPGDLNAWSIPTGPNCHHSIRAVT